MFDADQIRSATFVRSVEVHDTLGSTNDRAAELARQAHVELPALVVARIQTAGRGRGKNVWWSADGALTFSLLLDSKSIGVAAERWPQLSLTMAVAVSDALSAELLSSSKRAGSSTSPASVPRVGIKWPNDVLVDGKKICGILIESPGGTAPAKDRLIIGIGVNGNNSMRDAPPSAGQNATSVCDITGTLCDVKVLLTRLLQRIASRLDQLKRGPSDLATEWQRRSVVDGKHLRLQCGAQIVEGRCLGIATDGAIIIESAAGAESFISGHIQAMA